jgi:hypothetical protein
VDRDGHGVTDPVYLRQYVAIELEWLAGKMAPR